MGGGEWGLWPCTIMRLQKKKLGGCCMEAQPEINFFFLSDQMGSKNMQHFDGWDVEKRKGFSAAPLVTNLFVFFIYHLKILIPTSCQPPTIVDISLTGKLGSTLLLAVVEAHRHQRLDSRSSHLLFPRVEKIDSPRWTFTVLFGMRLKQMKQVTGGWVHEFARNARPTDG